MSTVQDYCRKWKQTDIFLNLLQTQSNVDVATMSKPRPCLSLPIILSFKKGDSNDCFLEKLNLSRDEWSSVFSLAEFNGPQIVLQIDELLYMFGEVDNETDEGNTVSCTTISIQIEINLI